ncbi:MAG: trypsin-like peptidase domain-containing protein [Verrucomicrobia bacterium]|nr:trypsin-like peptidase domain-containing protein [Verrucomicrobiota bacterium]
MTNALASGLRLTLLGFLWCLIPCGSAATGEAPFVAMLQATCRLSRDGHSGTGFLIQRDTNVFLVTAAHVFDESKAAEGVLIVREKQSSGEAVRKELPLVVFQDGQPLWKRHPSQDVAVLPLTLPANLDVVPLPVAQILRATPDGSSPATLGAEVWLPGYPAQLEVNAAAWPVLRRGTIASYPLSPVSAIPTLVVNIGSFGGDSGGPLFTLVDGVPRLVGVVSGMHRQTDRSITPYEERIQHTPLGLSIAVQADLVLTVLDQL